MTDSKRFVATDEQMANDPLLHSAHVAGLTERDDASVADVNAFGDVHRTNG